MELLRQISESESAGLEQNAMNRFGPVGRWQFLRVLPAVFQVFELNQEAGPPPVLSCRPVLIHDRMNGHGGMNARQVVPGLIASKGLDDRDGAMLTIIGIPAPPNHAEDLAGTEVVHAASLRSSWWLAGAPKQRPSRLEWGT
jgi:hypothetical protein